MAEIALALIDPDGKRHAQLVHDDLPLRELTIILAHRLELPRELSYRLHRLGGKQPLDEDQSLQAQKIAAGAELEIRPVKDRKFDLFIEALKAEIYSELKGEAKSRAKDTLATLLGSQQAAAELASTPAASAASGAAGEAATSGGAQAMPEAGPSPSPEPGASAGQSATTPDPVAQAAQAGRRGGGCLRWGCGLILVGGLAAAAALYFLYDDYIGPVIEPVIGFSITELLGGTAHSGEPVLGTGDVQVTLRWETPTDLDLHVIDPAGEEIWFANPQSASGGQLDVDANGQCGDDTPVENVYWPTDGAPTGSFDIYVVFYQDCGYQGAAAYNVSLLVDGVSYGPYEGVFSGSSGEQQYITTVER